MPKQIVKNGSARLLEEYKTYAQLLLEPFSAEDLILNFSEEQIKHFLEYLLGKMLNSDKEKAKVFFDFTKFDFSRFKRKPRNKPRRLNS